MENIKSFLWQEKAEWSQGGFRPGPSGFRAAGLRMWGVGEPTLSVQVEETHVCGPAGGSEKRLVLNWNAEQEMA